MLNDADSIAMSGQLENESIGDGNFDEETFALSSVGEPGIKRLRTDYAMTHIKKEACFFTSDTSASPDEISLSNFDSVVSSGTTNSPLRVGDVPLSLQTPTTSSHSAFSVPGIVPHTKRKRADLTPKIKKEICLFKESNPTLTQNSVCLYAQNVLGVNIGRSTVCDILKEKDKWIALGDIAVSTRIRRPKHEELENALSTWYAEMTAGDSQRVIGDDVLRDQAKLLGKQLGIEDFQYSNGWLSRFKARRGLHLARMERAAKMAVMEEGSSTQAAPDPQRDMNYLLASYIHDNIYYCETMNLDYRMDWHTNRSRDTINILLCTNISGSDKRTPLVVWKRQRARCFGFAFDPNKLCDWRFDKNLELTFHTFCDWLIAFDEECQKSGRRILLLCHVPSDLIANTPPLSNTTIYHLPSLHQSLDASPSTFIGVQEAFKCLMGLQQLSCLIEDIEEETWPPSMDVKRALYCLRDAWTDFPMEMLTERLHKGGFHVGLQKSLDNVEFMKRFNSLLGHNTDMNSTTVPPSVPIMAGLEDQDDSEAPLSVSCEEARKSVDSLMLFMEQNLGDNSHQFSITDLDCLRSVKKRCMALKREEMRREKIQRSQSHQPMKSECSDTDSSTVAR